MKNTFGSPLSISSIFWNTSLHTCIYQIVVQMWLNLKICYLVLDYDILNLISIIVRYQTCSNSGNMSLMLVPLGIGLLDV